MSTHCEVCSSEHDDDQKKLAKYSCPVCRIRTCSSKCVQEHKEKMGCNGKKDTLQFVPINSYNEETFFSDYKLLEEIHRASSSATAHLEHLKQEQFVPFHLQKRRRLLQNQAKRRNIKLLFLPRILSKSKLNTSFYSFREDSIFWSVRFVFPQEQLVWQLKHVKENSSLANIIKQILQPVPICNSRKQKLLQQKYGQHGVQELGLYLLLERMDNRKKSNENDQYQLEKCLWEKTLLEVLDGKEVVEFPSFIILLPEENINELQQNIRNECH